MRIEIQQLRRVIEALLSSLEERGNSFVELSPDYYWDIPADALYEMYREPSELTVGQLTDDWQELQKVLQDGREPILYHFVWLAAILRAIGQLSEVDVADRRPTE